MDIKYIHVTLIIFSIALFLGFGLWAFYHQFMVSACVSMALGAGLIVYCVKFISKMKAL